MARLAGFLILTTGLFLTAVGLIAPAAADDTGGLYVAPGPSTLISSDAVKRYQQQTGVATRKLGDIIGSSLQSPSNPATDLLVTTQCGRYKSATITYADGFTKTLNLGNAPATKTDMQQAKAAIAILRIEDLGNCAE
jgi:hypothetical protein